MSFQIYCSINKTTKRKFPNRLLPLNVLFTLRIFLIIHSDELNVEQIYNFITKLKTFTTNLTNFNLSGINHHIGDIPVGVMELLFSIFLATFFSKLRTLFILFVFGLEYGTEVESV